MRERVETICCDTAGCDAEVVGPAGSLARRAEQAGWQVGAVIALAISDDGPEMTREDHCPTHWVDALDRETVLRQAGGPGGIQPWQLR